MLEGEACLQTDIYVPLFEDIKQVEMKILRKISFCHGKIKKCYTARNWRV
jgi:hypothetical protein